MNPDDFIYDEELADEVLFRFQRASPRLQANPRLASDVYWASSGRYNLYVCLIEDETYDPKRLPRRFIYIVQVDYDQFVVSLQNMYFTLDGNTKITHLPWLLNMDELEHWVLTIWESILIKRGDSIYKRQKKNK